MCLFRTKKGLDEEGHGRCREVENGQCGAEMGPYGWSAQDVRDFRDWLTLPSQMYTALEKGVC